MKDLRSAKPGDRFQTRTFGVTAEFVKTECKTVSVHHLRLDTGRVIQVYDSGVLVQATGQTYYDITGQAFHAE